MIKLKNKIFFVIVTVMFCLSCSKNKELNQKEYLNFLNSEDSDLLVVKTLNNIQYTLRCQTPEQQCLSANKSIIKSQEDFENLMKDYKDRLNFILIIEDKKGGSNEVKQAVFNKESYGNILGYANSELGKDISLVTEKEILPCSLVHLEPANSIQPVLRLAVLFSGIKQTNNEVTFVFDDNIFKNGPIKFNYSQKTFTELPKLKIDAI